MSCSLEQLLISLPVLAAVPRTLVPDPSELIPGTVVDIPTWPVSCSQYCRLSPCECHGCGLETCNFHYLNHLSLTTLKAKCELKAKVNTGKELASPFPVSMLGDVRGGEAVGHHVACGCRYVTYVYRIL